MGLMGLLRGMGLPAPKKPAPKTRTRVTARPAAPVKVSLLRITGIDEPVEVRRSPRARRLSLKVDTATDTVRVTVPPRVADAEIAGFVGRHLDWVHARLAALPPRQPFTDGMVLPLLGRSPVIIHDPSRRTGARLVAGEGGLELRVGGDLDFLNRRVTDFLKAEARRHLSALTAETAARAGLRASAVTVRDTRSRWGSCSATGRISYSWRLILAPPPIVAYVVAHEVAHLQEMNHGPKFWVLCERLAGDVDRPRAWLKSHGTRLHRYG
ncbi:MAG: SprT family zinc-dependent metalloprotease [Azospirillaceae bacterium]|nr:SprT family zinc-dependent metalloprotease [Azospirillaceae bacterium]